MDILLHEVRETPRPKAKAPWCGTETRQPWLDFYSGLVTNLELVVSSGV